MRASEVGHLEGRNQHYILVTLIPLAWELAETSEKCHKRTGLQKTVNPWPVPVLAFPSNTKSRLGTGDKQKLCWITHSLPPPQIVWLIRQ